MKKTLLVLASALFGMSVGLSVYAADQAPAAAAPAAQAKTLGQIHGAMWPKSKDGYVTKYQCMQCHGDYDKLAKQTADLVPNPHHSHLGQVNCEDCIRPTCLNRFLCATSAITSPFARMANRLNWPSNLVSD